MFREFFLVVFFAQRLRICCFVTRVLWAPLLLASWSVHIGHVNTARTKCVYRELQLIRILPDVLRPVYMANTIAVVLDKHAFNFSQSNKPSTTYSPTQSPQGTRRRPRSMQEVLYISQQQPASNFIAHSRFRIYLRACELLFDSCKLVMLFPLCCANIYGPSLCTVTLAPTRVTDMSRLARDRAPIALLSPKYG